MKRIMNARVSHDSSTISCVVSKKTKEENPMCSITTELKKRLPTMKEFPTVLGGVELQLVG